MKVTDIKVLIRKTLFFNAERKAEWWWTIKFHKEGWTKRNKVKVYVLKETTMDSEMFTSKRECKKEANKIKKYLEGLK